MEGISIDVCLQPRRTEKTRLKKYFDVADRCFVPALSTQLDVEGYIEKLDNFASLIWCVDKGKDVALCAFYLNQPPQAFITSVSVLCEYQGNGLAKAMLAEMVKQCQNSQYKRARLEVQKKNIKAQRLYERIGFFTIGEKEEKYVMELKISTGDKSEGN